VALVGRDSAADCIRFGNWHSKPNFHVNANHRNFWSLGDFNKRLEAMQSDSTKRFDGLAKRLDELNKRLRCVDYKAFGVGRDDMLSGEWSARNNAAEYKP
jgi:hypothetical protein